MKIKISKSQWEEMGKKAGWMSPGFKFSPDDPKFGNDLSFMKDEDWKKLEQSRKEKKYPKEYPQCKGKKLVIEKVKNLGTLDYRDSYESCPTCRGKGYITKEDHDAYLHNMGVAPCPHCK